MKAKRLETMPGVKDEKREEDDEDDEDFTTCVTQWVLRTLFLILKDKRLGV